MQIRFRTADVPALAAAALLALYGVYLIVLGPVLTFVSPGGSATTYHDPNAAGLAPIIAGLLVWYGVSKGSDLVAWAGAVIATAFSILFVFGVGGIAIPAAAALLAALIVRGLLSRR